MRKKVMSESKISELNKVVSLSKSFRPAAQVFKKVESIPTIFPQYDHALRVGGHPLGRISVIHGPSNHGKTTLGLGLGLSFLQAGSYFLHIDAEMTTPVDWLKKLMGSYADSDRFLGYHPETYEGTSDAVREFLTNLIKEKENGTIDQKTSALILVDSLRKLIPQNFFAKIAKKGSEESGIDGFSGRGAQMKAALNSAWMDELVPLLHRSNASMVIIARESEDVNADANDRKYGRDYKITGGNAVIYDSSLVMRVERTGFTGKGQDEDRVVYGERHRVTVNKTKIASKTDRKQVAYFHSSNGVLTKEGFDTGRDLLEMGKKMNVIQLAGSWYSYAGKRVQGEDNFLKMLESSPEIAQKLDAEIRSHFDSVAPEEEADE